MTKVALRFLGALWRDRTRLWRSVLTIWVYPSFCCRRRVSITLLGAFIYLFDQNLRVEAREDMRWALWALAASRCRVRGYGVSHQQCMDDMLSSHIVYRAPHSRICRFKASVPLIQPSITNHPSQGREALEIQL